MLGRFFSRLGAFGFFESTVDWLFLPLLSGSGGRVGAWLLDGCVGLSTRRPKDRSHFLICQQRVWTISKKRLAGARLNNFCAPLGLGTVVAPRFLVSGEGGRLAGAVTLPLRCLVCFSWVCSLLLDFGSLAALPRLDCY